eukprot:scaffold15922_cov111-Isochrysis_galbana.AAC.11
MGGPCTSPPSFFRPLYSALAPRLPTNSPLGYDSRLSRTPKRHARPATPCTRLRPRPGASLGCLRRIPHRPPEADGSVVAGRGVRLAVRREAHPVDGAVVALVAHELLPRPDIVLVHPEVASARHERRLVRVQGGRVDAVAVPKGDLGARRHRHQRPVRRQLHRVDVPPKFDLPNGAAGAHVPYPHRLILTSGQDAILVVEVAHHLDAGGVAVQQLRLARSPAHQVEQPQLLLLAAGDETRRVGRPAGAPHNVLVRQRVQLIPGDGIPDLGRKVGRARDCVRRRAIQRGAPDRTLVPLKRADPVARLPRPQHRGLVVAG